MARLMTCPDCGTQVSQQASACPNCGRPLKKPARRLGCIGWGLILFVLAFCLLPALRPGSGPAPRPVPPPANQAPAPAPLPKSVRRTPGAAS
jgi:hypothetical protein